MIEKNKSNSRLYITVEFGKKVDGGIGRVINGICSHFTDKNQFDVLLLKFNLFRLDWDAVLYRGNDDFSQGKYNWNYINCLLTLLKTGNYGLVHLFHAGIPIANCLRVIRKHFPETKIVYSCHSISRYEINIRNNYLVSLDIEKYILENVDHIHVLNNLSRRLLSEHYPHVNTPVTIIPNGINSTALEKIDMRQRENLMKKMGKPGNVAVLCMSRWSYGKGLECLLKAAHLVIRERKNIRFIIAGRKLISWENNYFNYVRKITKQIDSLKGYVLSLGWLDDIRRNTVISIADIWVMPSLVEYFPYSILEPMAGKIPIISSEIDAVTDILTNNSDCLFYNPEAPVDLAGKIISLADDDEKRKELSRNAYSKVNKKYKWDMIAPMYMEMYDSVVTKTLSHVYKETIS